MSGKTEDKYFTEPPNYTQVQQNKQVLIVAAETVLTQSLTLMYKCTDPQNRKNLKNQHCCQCWSPRYLVSVLSNRYGGCHLKGLIVAS